MGGSLSSGGSVSEAEMLCKKKSVLVQLPVTTMEPPASPNRRPPTAGGDGLK